MDVLRPPLVWIDGRCFRKYSINVPQTDVKEETNAFEDDQYSVESEISSTDDEVCDSSCNIEVKKNGEYMAMMNTPAAYFGTIVGSKGAVKLRLESETKARIRVPHNANDGNIIVTSRDKRSIVSAVNRINLIVASARQKRPFTHFLSIPLISSEVRNSFKKFKSNVMENCIGVRGLDETIFQNPNKLHITIGTMPLLDKFEREKAINLLNSCKQTIKGILGGQTITVLLEGIEYMNDDPAEVDVLYAKIKHSESAKKLQAVAEHLIDVFVEDGLMHRQYERVKLHATIMNTLFRKDNAGVWEINRRGPRVRESFDASWILQAFKEVSFGEISVSEIQVSQRYGDPGSDGYYYCTGKLEL